MFGYESVFKKYIGPQKPNSPDPRPEKKGTGNSGIPIDFNEINEIQENMKKPTWVSFSLKWLCGRRETEERWTGKYSVRFPIKCRYIILMNQ